MNPPVGPDVDREVLAGGIAIEGQFLPPGPEFSVSLYSLHHNEDAFLLDAFKFKTEHWIPDEKAGITIAHIATYSSAFAPFSTGPRGCPGKILAYLEMSIVMAKILFLADIRAAEGNELGAGKADLIWGRRNKTHFQTKDRFVSSRKPGRACCPIQVRELVNNARQCCPIMPRNAKLPFFRAS